MNSINIPLRWPLIIRTRSAHDRRIFECAGLCHLCTFFTLLSIKIAVFAHYGENRKESAWRISGYIRFASSAFLAVVEVIWNPASSSASSTYILITQCLLRPHHLLNKSHLTSQHRNPDSSNLCALRVVGRLPNLAHHELPTYLFRRPAPIEPEYPHGRQD